MVLLAHLFSLGPQNTAEQQPMGCSGGQEPDREGTVEQPRKKPERLLPLQKQIPFRDIRAKTRRINHAVRGAPRGHSRSLAARPGQHLTQLS